MRNLFLGFSSCGLIVVSLDGLSSESHNKLRGKGQFRKTASNLVWLIKQRRAKKLNFEIHVTFVINKLNLHEAARAVAAWSGSESMRLTSITYSQAVAPSYSKNRYSRMTKS
jgi:sulfatase maturation enzyme AslB (radical SAM superfamily)